MRLAQPGLLHEKIALAQRQRERLFDEHVLACAQGRRRHFGMQYRRHADGDEVDVSVRQQIPVGGKARRAVTLRHQ